MTSDFIYRSSYTSPYIWRARIYNPILFIISDFIPTEIYDYSSYKFIYDIKLFMISDFISTRIYDTESSVIQYYSWYQILFPRKFMTPDHRESILFVVSDFIHVGIYSARLFVVQFMTWYYLWHHNILIVYDII